MNAPRSIAVLVCATLALAGCMGHSATGPAGLPTQACGDAARAAASAAPSAVDSARLDAVLRGCVSQRDLEAAGSEYPGAFGGGDTDTVADVRCRESPELRNVQVCIDFAAFFASPSPDDAPSGS